MKRRTKICIIVLIVILTLLVIGTLIFNRLNREIEEMMLIEITEINLLDVEDGVYVGSYEITLIQVEVKVTVAQHEIVEIQLLKHQSGQGGPAEAILFEVINAQSLHVDHISGATYSSHVILLAIENALSQAPS
ncbi:MAG: FMN-binding protein [Acholeplasmataceae bacterium]|nr:FMN-binding protein [Acholeplasmataceae bacterium]